MIKEIIKLLLMIIAIVGLSSIAYYAKKSFYKDIIKESLIEMKKKE